MHITVDLDLDKILQSLSSYDRDREEIIDIILGIDLAIAEVDFTENLIRKLAESLISELTDEPKKRKLAKKKLKEFFELINGD